jgi:hypothetical protein
MKPIAWMLLFVVLLQCPADAGGKSDKAACKAVTEKIRAIEARMREGYTAAQGIRYEARLRELKDKRYKLCRK